MMNLTESGFGQGARSRVGWAFLVFVAWPMAVRGQAIVLSDIVGNGDGSGNAVPGVVGIDPDTGVFRTSYFHDDVVNTGNPLQAVASNASLDSVFIITAQTIPINTQGVTFQFSSGDVSSGTWNWILKDTTHDIDTGTADISCGGIDSFANGIGIHASVGITFDLGGIRADHGAANVKHLTCFAGRNPCGAPGGLVNLYAILSNASQVISSVSRIAVGGNRGEVLELAIPDNALYLTLACGASNGGDIGCDHGVFAEAVIAAQPIKSGVRTVSAPSGATGCPPGAGGPASVNIRREGSGTQAVTVTERIFGVSGTADVAAQNGGVVSTYIPPASDAETTSGFITAWLLLGPFSRTGGPAPGEAAIRLDYLTDGAAIFEAGVQPGAGDTVHTDLNGAAASTGLPIVTGGINPGAVPTWAQWLDTDDTVRFADYYGGDVNDIMMYAVCYLRVAASVQVDFCVGSDDAVQLLLDGSEIHINNIARGAGASEACNDTVAGVVLTAGIHRVMMKVFEGSNDHGFRLGVFNTGTRVPAAGVNVCLNPLAPNPCPLGPAGVQVTWNTTRNQLNSPGVGYSVDFGARNLRFRGTIEQRTTLGTGGLVLSLPAVEYGPFLDPAFDHAHNIGLPCPGTSVTSTQPGTLAIAGAGSDIWVGGDQFMFAYTPVTGDFIARVTITDRAFAPGSRWGKHGIMARQDCTISSRYSFIHDQGEDLQDATRMANRPTHGGVDNFEIIPAAAPPGNHASTLRLDRCGNEFISFVLDEAGSFGGDPGDWVEIGRHEWAVDPPATVLVGLAVTSHAACATTTITFDDWELFPACDAPVGDLTCVADATGGLDLTWVNPPSADPAAAITIKVNGIQVTTVPGSSTSASLPASNFPPGQISTIDVINSSSVASKCSYPPELNAAGFIKTWLILGPLMRPGGAAPGENQIILDYLTDGVTTQENVQPVAGQSILPDYGNLAASTGLAATPGRTDINPGGVPAWFEWNDPDDTIDYFDVFNTDINNVMCYAAAYVDVPEGTTVDIGIDSDDAVQVLIDGVEVHINNIARGMGGPNAVADTVPGVDLAAGRHLILVKVFEGTASHGFRLRFQDGGVPPNPAIPGRICLDPDCSQPQGPLFLRGDVNNDGWVSMGDALYILNHGYLGGPGPTCPEAADTNSDGTLDGGGLSDAIYLLNFLFLQGPMPGSYPGCELASSPLCVYPVTPCGAFEVRNPEPTLRLEFGVERLVEEGVSSNPVAAAVRLRNTEPGDFFVRGWSLSIRAGPHPDCAILDATTQGTLAAEAAFEITRDVDPEGSGVVSSIVLALTSATTLPGNEVPHDLLHFSLRGTFVAGECSPCLLEFHDGLASADGARPVRNLVDSGTRDFQPFSRPAEVRFCSAATPLAPGGAPADLSLPAATPTALFRLEPRPAAGTVITLDLEGADPGDRTALYVRWGGAPGPTEFDHAADERGRASQRLVVPFARNEPCYVLVRGNVAAGGEIEATLRATASGIALERASADCGAEGCDGMIHLAVQGAGFDATTSFFLERPPGLNLPALERMIVSAERAEVTFDLSATSPGVYDLVTQKGSGPTLATARLAGAVRVERKRIGPRLEVSLEAPTYYREYQLRSLTLRYANTGDEEMRAPLFEVRASPADTRLGVAEDAGIRRWEIPDFVVAGAGGPEVVEGPLQVFGIHAQGIPGRLPAGASGEIPILFRHPDPFSNPPLPGERLQFFLRVLDTGPGGRLDWSSLGRPQDMTSGEWNGLRAALAGEHGLDYHEALSRVASRLTKRGERAWRVKDIFRFAALAATGRPTAVIIGSARGPSQGPLSSRLVGALQGGQVVTCALTDSEGAFALGPLPDGAYRLAIEGHVIPLTNVTISAGEDVFPVVLQASSENGFPLACPPAAPDAGLFAHPPGLPDGLLVPAAEAALKPAVSEDPNAKEGPDEDLPVIPGQNVRYTLHFENCSETTNPECSEVEAAARKIVLIDELSSLLDPATIKIAELQIGELKHLAPAVLGGTSLPSGYSWSTNSGRYDLKATMPVSVDYPPDLAPVFILADYEVSVVSTLDQLMDITFDLCGVRADPALIAPDECAIQQDLAMVSERMKSIPPATHIIWVIRGQDPVTSGDPGEYPSYELVGLVPPNHVAPMGQGLVAYDVRVSEGAMDEEEIENKARIIFDTNPGDPTDPVKHTVRVPFRRGDVDDNGAVDLTDPIAILNCLFVGSKCPDCLDAADANDDGSVNVSDPISVLNFLFVGLEAPKPPGPYECGFDLTEDDDELPKRNLGCGFNPLRCR